MPRCGICGNKNLEKKNQKGKSFPYKELEIVLEDDLFVLECSCKNTVVSSKDISLLDPLLRKVYDRKLKTT